jgi:hypothetical protein
VSSDSESEDEDVFDIPAQNTRIVNNEHSDPNSFSWLVLRMAILRIVQTRLNDFLSVSVAVVNFENELGVIVTTGGRVGG